MRLIIGAAALAILGLKLGGVAIAGDLATIDIKEWEVPYEKSRPRDPFAKSEDSVWFVGQKTGYLAHLDVTIGEFKKIDLKEGSGPHNLIVGSDGIVWYAGNRTALIGRYDPKTEEIEEIAMPDPAARDPHTLVFDAGEENIFFTLQGANMIGRMNIETREVTLVNSKTERSRPYGIKVAPNGEVYVVLLDTNKMAQINPETMALAEIDLPREEARPRRMEITADGRVWYVDYAKGYLGAYDPATEEFEEWAFPQGEQARPYGMASDASGNIWAVATGVEPNMFMGFDSEAEEWISATPIPSGGGTLRHMHYHQPSGAVWFGADTNTIGRAIVEPSE